VELNAVNGRRARTQEEFTALHQLAILEQNRQELRQRWDRQLVPLRVRSLSETEPERVAVQYVAGSRDALSWADTVLKPLEEEMGAHGFLWPELLAKIPPRTGEHADLLHLRDGVVEHFEPAFAIRIREIRRDRANGKIRESSLKLAPAQEAEVVKRLAHAAASLDPVAYRKAFGGLQALAARANILATRRDLLARLEKAAPSWAAAIRDRVPPHGDQEAPGDTTTAWLWRQLADEIEVRSTTSLDDLQQRLTKLTEDLRHVTTDLVDGLAWMAQLHRTSLAQRQALMGWLQTIRRIGRGTGKRAPRLRIEAQRLMGQSRDAVPVWVMPLSRVVENFGPQTTRFDVLIIDEASQCDVMGLIAIYLAKSVVIVGDHEQVSPDAIGQRIDEVEHLIREHLQGIPNSHLYDGQQSIYDIAMQSFGGLICLREHFRCAPDIIQFSNELSYHLQIKPLRDASQISLRPHVLEYRVNGLEKENNVNEEEALAVASLLAAAVEQQEYAGETMGVISLLGVEQARAIDHLLRRYLEPSEYERRRIVCGNAAHFQGDERDVMFLSMVWGPADGPLSLLEAGPRDMYKKRFNVAASRGRDQMWVVHSVSPEVDLQPSDLRRRLIEHARNPEALLRRLQRQEERTESEFEREMLRRLTVAGYRVTPQWQVGHYRIDLVVEGGGKRVAVECDGDRYHPLEQLRDDMQRQAILERIGWTFIRLRGTEFFRDPDGTMELVVDRLRDLGVSPEGTSESRDDLISQDSELVDRVIRRAAELREDWKAREPTAPWEAPRPDMHRFEQTPSGIEAPPVSVSQEYARRSRTAPSSQARERPRQAPQNRRARSEEKSRGSPERLPAPRKRPLEPKDATTREILGWPASTWKALAKWGKDTEFLNPVERRFCFKVGQLIIWRAEPTERQLKWAQDLQRNALRDGFTPD
jgi:very-short-patch-repair endonuclease